MSETLNPLDQVKLDAERITRKRMQEQEESIAWQEAQAEQPVTLDDSVQEAERRAKKAEKDAQAKRLKAEKVKAEKAKAKAKDEAKAKKAEKKIVNRLFGKKKGKK